MKFSEQWLREWVSPKLSTEKLCDQLTALGLEVDSASSILPAVEKVVVGEVVEREKHPDADRLSCCKVKISKTEILDIVCGAANVRKGLKVAVVLVGGELPGGLKIKSTKLRGQPSEGMICSAKELGLTTESEGILELPQDAPVGKNIVDYLQLNDHVIEVEFTPNRGDCLSILGLARELASKNKLKINEPKIKAAKVKSSAQLKIELKNKLACSRYCGRVIENINAKAQSPIWLTEKLRRSGLRAIHPVVDVMNYVMLELGQPMHAFDLAKISKKICVRNAKENETIKLLDESEIKLNTQNLVIADDHQALALAGVMGGFDSAVSPTTESIFLESAYFDAKAITKTARQYAISTDSSYRFERGVDFNLPRKALERATELLLEIVGGKAGKIIEAVEKTNLPKRTPIKVPAKEIERLLGAAFTPAECKTIWTNLNMTVKKSAQTWSVTPPSYRFDMSQSADCVEELARVRGLDSIKPMPLQGDLKILPTSESLISVARIAQTLINRGYSEAITYSFVDRERQQKIVEVDSVWELRNPLSQELAVMRTSLWPNMISAWQFNVNRSADCIRLFETGHIFLKEGDTVIEKNMLAGVAGGQVRPTSWSEPTRAVDFFDVKGDLEALLKLIGKNVQFRPAQHPSLHPGQSAEICIENKVIGYVGALHPQKVQELDLAAAPYLFELELDALMHAALPSYCLISKFPAVSRDLAIVVDEAVQASDLMAKIEADAGNLLKQVKIFDIYRGQGIAVDCKSVALGLTFENLERTLQDEEITAVVERVVKGLEHAFNAKLRE